jgi:hypothetical protein
MIRMHRITMHGSDIIETGIETVVIAGWAGRDEAAIRHHIEELAAIGVPRPSSVPVFYRVSAATLTQTGNLDVLGPNSSGEVEPVIIALADGLWVGLGSDHTDRKAETFGIALSKQLCGKVIGTSFWPFAEVEAHWDRIEMRAHIVIAGDRVLYQSGTLASLRPPRDLIARWKAGAVPGHTGDPAPDALLPGTLMFGGTLGAEGGIRPADRFEMTLHDPVLGRTLTHAYDIRPLPVVS